MNHLQELEALQDACFLLDQKKAETCCMDAIWTKLYHAKLYLNGRAVQILNTHYEEF